MKKLDLLIKKQGVDLVTITVLNIKIAEFENIILDVSGLVKKTDYNS